MITIMRGIPGSGKTTWVKKHRKGAHVVSADDYFMQGGQYCFSPALLGEAHKECLRKFVKLLLEGYKDIVVDNTNVRAHEIAPYYRLAEAYERPVEIVWCLAHPADAAARNIHGVPHETVHKMALSFESLPPGWVAAILTH